MLLYARAEYNKAGQIYTAVVKDATPEQNRFLYSDSQYFSRFVNLPKKPI